MAHIVPTDPDRQLSLLRKLKALVVILILSNLALGLFGVYYLRVIDRKYSDLISRAVPALNDLQELTALSAHAMRTTNPGLFGNATRVAIAERGRAALERDRELRDRLLKLKWLSDNRPERLKLKEAGDEFDSKAGEVVEMFGADRTAEATQLREQTLRPLFDRYVTATSDAADLFQSQSLKTSNVFTERTQSISKMMLGFASWPVIALAIFFGVTTALAIAVLLLFDRTAA